jgi:hypothetical protein
MGQTSAAGTKGWIAAACAGVIAGLAAAHAHGPSAPTMAPVQVVDRSLKGDRLDATFSPALDARASGRIALRHLFERVRNLELRETCEPPASPIVDPRLANLPGRCLT